MSLFPFNDWVAEWWVQRLSCCMCLYKVFINIMSESLKFCLVHLIAQCKRTQMYRLICPQLSSSQFVAQSNIVWLLRIQYLITWQFNFLQLPYLVAWMHLIRTILRHNFSQFQKVTFTTHMKLMYACVSVCSIRVTLIGMFGNFSV